MKWILSLIFVLTFGFCVEAQKYDSITANVIPVFKGYQLEVKDTSKPIYYESEPIGSEIISGWITKEYLVKAYTAIIYYSDSVKFLKKTNFFWTNPKIDSAFKNLKDGETIEFRDIFFFKPYSPPAFKLNKKLLITNKNGKVTSEILPDFSENKIDNSGRLHGNWKTIITQNSNDIFIENAIYNYGKPIGEWTIYKFDNLWQKINYINDTLSRNTQFYKNGNKQFEVNFLRWDTSGAYNEFHINGKIKTKGNYILLKVRKEYIVVAAETWDPYSTRDSSVWLNTSIKDKTWEYFNTKGILIRKEIYEQGKLIRKEDY